MSIFVLAGNVQYGGNNPQVSTYQAPEAAELTATIATRGFGIGASIATRGFGIGVVVIPINTPANRVWRVPGENRVWSLK